MRRLSGLIVTLMLGASSLLQANFTPLVEGTGRVGDFLKGGGAQVWAPFYTTGSSVAFVQGGGGYFNDTGAINLGVGFRHAACRSWGWGVNGFFDHAPSNHRHASYFQGGVGLEAFGACWLARGNAYFPGANRRTIGVQSELLDMQMGPNGNDVDIIELFKDIFVQPYYGVDLEAGASLCVPGGEVWGFAGYYYFDAEDVKPVQGPRLRAEYRLIQPAGINVEVTAGGEWHYDHLHQHQGAFELRVLVPFGCNARSSYATSCRRSVCKRMAQPVRRQPVIWAFEDLERGGRIVETDLLIIFVEENGTGVGTQVDPTNLVNAEAIADPNDIVILMTTGMPAPGEITATAPINLQDGQQWGSFAGQPDITLTVVGGGTVTIPNLFNSQTAVINAGAFDIFNVASNTNLFDIITNGGQNAVVSNNQSNVLVQRLDIRSPSADGVNIVGGTSHTLDAVTITTPGVNGINLNGSATAVITNATVTGGTGVSLLMTNQSGATVSGSSFTGAATGALAFSAPTGNFSFSNSTFDPASGETINIEGGSASMTFTGNTINAVPGVRLLEVGLGGNGGANSATFTGGTFTTNGGEGVRVQNTSGGSINISTAASLQNTPSIPVVLNVLAGNFSMPNADIDPVANVQGIDIDQASGNVTIGGTLDTDGAVAISIDNGSGQVDLSALTTTALGGTNPIQVQNNLGGSISFGPVLLLDPGSTGFLFDTNAAAINVASAIVTSNTGATAFRLNNQDGNVTVTDGLLTLTAGGKIVDIDGGSAVINMAGVSAASSGSPATPIDVQGTVGGSFTLATGGGESVLITDPTGQGILLSGNAGSQSFGNLTLNSNTSATGLAITNQTGNVTFATSTVSLTNGGIAVDIDNASGLTNLAGLTVSSNLAPNQAVRVANTTTGTHTFGPVTITNAALTGIFVDSTSGGSILFPGAVNINTAITGIHIDNTSGGLVDFDTTTITNATTGVLETNTTGGTVDVGSMVNITGGNVGISIQNNTGGMLTFGEVTLTDQAVTGVAIGTATANSVPITFNSLVLNAPATSPLGLDIQNQSGPVTVNLPGTFTQPNGAGAIRVTNASAAISLAPVSVNNTSAGTAVEVTGTFGGGSVALGNMILNSSGTGINLQNNTAGSLTFGDVTITNPVTAAVNIGTVTANTVPITFNSLSLNAAATSPTGLTIVNQSGAVTVTNPSTFSQPNGGTSFTVTSATAAINLGQIDVTDNGSVAGAAIAVDVQGTSGGGSVTLGDLTLNNSAVGINLQNNTNGPLIFGDILITDPVSTGIAIGTATVNNSPILFSQVDMGISTGATGLDIVGQTGTVTVVNPGTMNHTAGGISLSISGGTANYALTPLTINSDAATVAPIQVVNTTGGAVNFGTVGITNVNSADSVVLTNNVANVDFASLSVAGTAGTVNVNGGAGTFGVTTGSINLSNDGALLVNSKAIAGGGVNFTSVTTTGGTNAIDLATVSGGPVAIGTATITNPTSNGILLNTTSMPFTVTTLNMNMATFAPGIATTATTGAVTISGGLMTHTGDSLCVDINGGTSVHDYTGLTLSNDGVTGNPAIRVQNTTGGSVAFGTVGLTNVAVLGGPSVELFFNGANIDFANLSVSGITGFVDCNGGAGTFGIATANLNLTSDLALRISDKTLAGGGVNISNLTALNGNGGLQLQSVISGGPLVIQSLTITNSFSDAISVNGGNANITIGNPAADQANISGGAANAITLNNTSGGSFTYYGRLLGGGPASLMLSSQNCTGSITINGTQGVTTNRFFAQTGGDGMLIQNAFGNVDIRGCSSTGALGDGYRFDNVFGPTTVAQNDAISSLGNGMSVTNQNGALTCTNNQIASPGLVGILIDNYNNALANISSNTFPQPVALRAIDFSYGGPFNLFVTCQNNAQLGPDIGAPTYNFNHFGPGMMNVNPITGNTSTQTGVGTGIRLANPTPAGINVGPGANTLTQVDANNPGMASPAFRTNILAPPNP